MTMLERVKNLTEKECIVDVLRKELADNKCRNCGKCTFGYEGATQLEMVMNDLAEKKARPGDLELLNDLCSVMKDQSMCEDGEDIALAFLEAMNRYGKDLQDHAVSTHVPRMRFSAERSLCMSLTRLSVFSAVPARTPVTRMRLCSPVL